MGNEYRMTETTVEEVLLRKIKKLEEDHDRLKNQISNLKTVVTSKVFENEQEGGADALNLMDSQYENILQSMGQSVHIFDLNNRIIYWNQMAQNLYGYTVEEVLGKTAPDIIIGPEYAEFATFSIQRAAKGEIWSGQFPVRNKHWEKFNVITTLAPCRDQNGTTFGVTCICADCRQFRPRSNVDVPSHQPLQSTVVSKILNLGSEVKMNMQTTNMDHDYNERHENRPRLHNGLSVKVEAWMGNKWPWKGNHNINIDGFSHIRPSRLDWPWLHNNNNDQEHELVPQTSRSEIIEFPGSSWSYSSSDSIDLHTENLDVEIPWDDLIIREQVEQGSSGTVYHALLYGSDVAVKIFNKQEYPKDVILSFRKEVCLMKRLRYPNILLFMGAVVSPQHLCIVTEFLPRGSLLRLLHRSTKKLDWKRRVHMAMDIARGMNYLHHCQPPIIHRDLKSSNILVDKNWKLKVGDFGLSRIKHETYLATSIGIGTPPWTAPEVLRNEQVDEKSDVYSFGVVLWEITTGKIPWENLNSMQVIQTVGFLNERLKIPNDVDPQWASLIESCWLREPQSRPTFQEMLIKLKVLQKKFTVQIDGS